MAALPERLLGRLHRFAEAVAALLLAVIFIAFLLQIVLRYVFNWPVGWTTELSLAAWLWLVLWGAAFVLRDEEEIRIDLLTVNLKVWNGMTPARQRAFQAAADKAIAWSTAEHQKREAELAEGFRRQGLDVYVPNVAAFREHAQKVYLASEEAKTWPAGMLDKINAMT